MIFRLAAQTFAYQSLTSSRVSARHLAASIRAMSLLNDLKKDLDSKRVPSEQSSNPFKLLRMSESFKIDKNSLETARVELLRQHHPDRFARQSQEQARAMAMTAAVNRAAERLLDPVQRGLALLEMLGSPIEENSKADGIDSPDFLMMMMEMNEVVEDGDADQLAGLQSQVEGLIAGAEVEATHAFEAKDIAKAKGSVMKLRYLCNLKNKIAAKS
eukprot:TRINITY_DN11416_c1_g2_i1.p1 TRINITY_DN11416_c1_g2~~TRINITY_DN11416_c1_g2_i1.p1  ORF type:complete len:215 (+),score=24.66 TRINITY_DN11416_c1_g2_i1:372-1016(+)